MFDLSQEKLFLSEIFDSIQGETSFSGQMTTFLRLSGCPLRCSWCDSTYSFNQSSAHSFKDLFLKIETFGWKYVCITGGEPLMQKPVIPFMEMLLQKNYVVSLETSGAVSTELVPKKVVTILDIKCPGSGMSHKNMYENFSFLQKHDQIKFVLLDRYDYDWAKEILHKYDLATKVSDILFSPVWDHLSPKELIDWIKQDSLKIRLNLQLHKYVWGPTIRGV